MANYESGLFSVLAELTPLSLRAMSLVPRQKGAPATASTGPLPALDKPRWQPQGSCFSFPLCFSHLHNEEKLHLSSTENACLASLMDFSSTGLCSVLDEEDSSQHVWVTEQRGLPSACGRLVHSCTRHWLPWNLSAGMREQEGRHLLI